MVISVAYKTIITTSIWLPKMSLCCLHGGWNLYMIFLILQFKFLKGSWVKCISYLCHFTTNTVHDTCTIITLLLAHWHLQVNSRLCTCQIHTLHNTAVVYIIILLNLDFCISYTACNDVCYCERVNYCVVISNNIS